MGSLQKDPNFFIPISKKVKAADSAPYYLYMMDTVYKCKYCGKLCKNRNAYAQHEIRCKNNPNRIKLTASSQNIAEYNRKIRAGELNKTNSNQFTKAKNCGLPKPEVSQETRQKLSEKSKARRHTPESIEKIAMSMRRVVREKPESYSASNVNGRVKKVEYNGYILDSSWEVEVAKFLDSIGVEWERPINGFEYEYDGKTHVYYPDFYLPNIDIYIEVKGHKRDRDISKWKVVHNLIVITKKEISMIKTGTYKFPGLI